MSGIVWQDCSRVIELLLSKGYQVHRIVRCESFDGPSLVVNCFGNTLHASIGSARGFCNSTGQLHTIFRDFLSRAGQILGENCEKVLKINQNNFLTGVIVPLFEDGSNARQLFDWKPIKSLGEMIEEMVIDDVAILKEAN